MYVCKDIKGLYELSLLLKQNNISKQKLKQLLRKPAVSEVKQN